jgi:predicted phosphate transport protein (TIGR00153 family)
MKETRNILGWLGMAEQRTTLRVAEEHVNETCQTVAYLAEAVKTFISGDLSAKTLAIAKVKQSERAADKLRARMVAELSEGLLLPPDREDLMRFAKALDKIADSTNSAARTLGLIEATLPANVLKNMSISTDMVVSGVGKLGEAIHAMAKNDIKEALRGCDEVERIEHEADDQKRLLLDAILHSGLDCPSLLLSYNLAEALEGITDRIDTASDMIKLLAVKAK